MINSTLKDQEPTDMDHLPTIFISHGPPFILLGKTPTVTFLKSLGKQLPRPKAIVCISAHWESLWPMATSASLPETIHDFSGPGALFSYQYPAPGSPDLAKEIITIIKETGIKATEESKRGLDHGVWVPLMLMYPEADIPLVQLSIQTEMDPSHHFKLGRALSPLTERGILVLSSGGAVHNLDEVYQYQLNSDPPGYIIDFDNWLNEMIAEGKTDNLLNYKDNAPYPEKCHPYPAEHFLPLFVSIGAARSIKKGIQIHKGFMYGTLSMAAYMWE